MTVKPEAVQAAIKRADEWPENWGHNCYSDRKGIVWGDRNEKEKYKFG